MADKILGNNQVNIYGEVVSEFAFSHEVYGEGFYMVYLSVKRLSQVYDKIPLMVSERLIDITKDYRGMYMEASGQFRSYNRHEENHNRLVLSVFVRDLHIDEEEMEVEKPNYIFLDGYLEKDYSTYNFETNCFELYSTLEAKPVTKWIDKIQKIIIQQGFFCGIECTEYFDFTYKDYKQKLIQKTMIDHGGIIQDIKDTGNYEFKVQVDIEKLEDEQIFNEIKEQLERLVLYNDAKN